MVHTNAKQEFRENRRGEDAEDGIVRSGFGRHVTPPCTLLSASAEYVHRANRASVTPVRHKSDPRGIKYNEKSHDSITYTFTSGLGAHDDEARMRTSRKKATGLKAIFIKGPQVRAYRIDPTISTPDLRRRRPLSAEKNL
ncbi:hypothetical protein MTO96_000562 [Rhipicephalus appendiculatus]